MSTYSAILTRIGEAKIANATALGQVVNITTLAVGDANGNPYLPNPAQTALVHEQRRAPLNQLDIDPQNPSQIIAGQVIPETAGGWWIRECGLFDAAGDLIAVANCPDLYKPDTDSGTASTQLIQIVLRVSNTAAVQILIDPAIVLATREYADQRAAAAVSAHEAKPDPHPQYYNDTRLTPKLTPKANLANPTFTGTPKVPAKTSAATTDGTLIATEAQVKTVADAAAAAQDKANTAAPVGTVVFSARSSAPSGWIAANGAALSRTAYATLFAAIGTAFGAGDGSTTFNVPDLRGEFVRGWDNGRGVDAGRVFGSAQVDLFKSHTHTWTTPWGTNSPQGKSPQAVVQLGPVPTNNQEIISGSNASTGGTETRPRNVALLAYIKY
jgi:phage-related tail fiber protein